MPLLERKRVIAIGTRRSRARLPALAVAFAGAFAVATGCLPARPALASAERIEAGDRAWSLRAEALDERLARPARIESAIVHYRAALEDDPGSVEAAWKLLRALHYAIDFTTLQDETRDARLAEAIELARAWVDRLETHADATHADFEPGRPERARLLFWSAIAWGARGQRAGLLTIVREGVAGRIHDCAERALALDPSVDRGGPLRLLSRLHATLPRVPFVSGWVDRERALPLAERARTLDPEHPGNRLVLALALLEHAPERADEARALLESVVRAEPRPEALVEDLAIQSEAEAELEAVRRRAD